MKKVFSFAASIAFVFAVVGVASVSADRSEDNRVVAIANGTGKTKMQAVKHKVQQNMRHNRFLRQCMEHGNSEDSCEMREEAVVKGTRELRREERRAFVDMIVDSKLSCIDEMGKENRMEVRKCFREKVKMGVVDRIKSIRDFRKDCRDELPEDALAKEVNLCALQKHLGKYVTVLEDEDEDDEDENMETRNIVEVASDTDDLSTLVTAVTAAELAETLSGDGPFTVFAPVNSAFENLDEGLLESLLEEDNQDNLQGVLLYHVIEGKVMSTDLSDGMNANTLNGGVTITIDGNTVMVNDATVTQADIETSNGVVHLIDTVLLPGPDEEEEDDEDE